MKRKQLDILEIKKQFKKTALFKCMHLFVNMNNWSGSMHMKSLIRVTK